MQMKRLESLDALRGFDMIWIIGLEQAMRGFCVLFPGGQDWWFKRQFHHVPWDYKMKDGQTLWKFRAK